LEVREVNSSIFFKFLNTGSFPANAWLPDSGNLSLDTSSIRIITTFFIAGLGGGAGGGKNTLWSDLSLPESDLLSLAPPLLLNLLALVVSEETRPRAATRLNAVV